MTFCFKMNYSLSASSIIQNIVPTSTCMIKDSRLSFSTLFLMLYIKYLLLKPFHWNWKLNDLRFNSFSAWILWELYGCTPRSHSLLVPRWARSWKMNSSPLSLVYIRHALCLLHARNFSSEDGIVPCTMQLQPIWIFPTHMRMLPHLLQDAC